MYVPPLSKILISSGAFHYWFQSLPLMRRLEFALHHIIFSDLLVDGLEISTSHQQLKSWAFDNLARGSRTLPEPYKRLSSAFNKRLLKLKSHTVHLDSLAKLRPAQIKSLVQQLSIVHEQTGIRDFTVHPDEVSISTWDRLSELLPPQLTLSVENMDPRKSSGQKLTDIQALLDRYPKLHCTFDLCHWIENGFLTDSLELKTFLKMNESRISKLHFSVPRTECVAYAALSPSYHYLSSGSGVRIASDFYMNLQPGLTWVVEGVIPPNNAKLLLSELGSIRELSTLSSLPIRKIASR